jgi:hypothetical protein
MDNGRCHGNVRFWKASYKARAAIRRTHGGSKFDLDGIYAAFERGNRPIFGISRYSSIWQSRAQIVTLDVRGEEKPPIDN